jgi:type IV pilus assembly protein PilE
MKPIKKSAGFTLAELMIVVAIVAILASIAYPSYRQYVIRSNRSEVQQFMMDIANREEQFLLDTRIYGTCCLPTVNPSELNMTIPSRIQQFYAVAVAVNNAATPPSYTITATPVSGTMQASDGTLTLNSQGIKSPADKWK